MDIRLALMAGIDIPVPECQLIVHQPSIQEIAFIGEETFWLGRATLCVNASMYLDEDDDDKDVQTNSTNFQIFMMIMKEPETAEKRKAVEQVLCLLLPDYRCFFTPRALVLQGPQGNITIDDNNFDALQDTIKAIFCDVSGPQDQSSFNPANEKAREIAKKLMKGRQRVAAQNGSANASIFSQYLSSLTIGTSSMTLQDLLQLTMYQLYDLVERYSLYIGWDLDIRIRLAGGKPDSHPDNWMKNIH